MRAEICPNQECVILWSPRNVARIFRVNMQIIWQFIIKSKGNNSAQALPQVYPVNRSD